MRWSHWSGAWSEQRVNGRSRKYSKYYQRESSALTRWPGTPSLLYCTWPLSALTNPTDIFQRAIDPRLPAGIKQPPAFRSRSECRLKGREKLGVWSSISLQRAFFTCTNAAWHCSVDWTRSGVTFQGRSVKGLVSSATVLETRESVGSPWLNPLS